MKPKFTLALLLTAFCFFTSIAQSIEDYYGSYMSAMHSGSTTAEGYESCPDTETLVIEVMPGQAMEEVVIQLYPAEEEFIEVPCYIEADRSFYQLYAVEPLLEVYGEFLEGEKVIKLVLVSEYGECEMFIYPMEDEEIEYSEQPVMDAPMISEEDELALKEYSATIYFNSGTNTFKSQTYEALERIIQIMVMNPEANFVIEGHTDSTGSESVNNELSLKRAQAVLDYLVNNGIEDYRLTSVGYGGEKPIASNETRAGRAQNRRIEINLVN